MAITVGFFVDGIGQSEGDQGKDHSKYESCGGGQSCPVNFCPDAAPICMMLASSPKAVPLGKMSWLSGLEDVPLWMSQVEET